MKYLFPKIYPDSYRIRACELFAQGMPAKTLAFMYGVNMSTIRLWSQEKGIKVYKTVNLSEIQGEIWVPVKEFEGLYEVSNLGRVKSLQRVGNQYTTRIRKEQESFGYPALMLSKEGKFTAFTIHRLLAIHFIPNPLNLKYVNHKNGIKTDYSLSNLEWSTKTDDILHALKTGLRVPKKLGGSKLAKKIASFTADGTLVKEYSCSREASNEMKHHNQCITFAARKGKMSCGLYWKYI